MMLLSKTTTLIFISWRVPKSFTHLWASSCVLRSFYPGIIMLHYCSIKPITHPLSENEIDIETLSFVPVYSIIVYLFNSFLSIFLINEIWNYTCHKFWDGKCHPHTGCSHKSAQNECSRNNHYHITKKGYHQWWISHS